MGHIRLGAIPKTRPWQAVVASFAAEASSAQRAEPDAEGGTQGARAHVAEIAARTLKAAEAGIDAARTDEGLRYTFYLLTQVALASRTERWREHLGTLGIELSKDATLFELTARLHERIDRQLSGPRHATDVSEMAQKALGDSLTRLVAPRAETLFGDTDEHLRSAIRAVSTKRGFSELGQAFFGKFFSRFLSFYLSRVAASQLGSGALRSLNDLREFNRQLELYCHESAAIVRDFSGEWYSKTQFKQGIDLRNTGRFVAVAVKKLRDEPAHQRRRA